MPDRTKLLTIAVEACERDENTGICLGCGNTQEGVEPDARRYTCESCGQDKVFGAEEILVMLA